MLVTMVVSCELEIYPRRESPSIVDVSCVDETYPAEPRPVTVEYKFGPPAATITPFT